MIERFLCVGGCTDGTTRVNASPNANTVRRTLVDENLVEFLVRETGDALYAVVRYDPEDWGFLYVNDTVRDVFELWDREVGLDTVAEGFRQEAAMNAGRESLPGMGDFYCTLHLFEDWVVLHFSLTTQGIVFAYDAEAASNLSSFVDLCSPFIEDSLASAPDA
jgi:hypothetical protein